MSPILYQWFHFSSNAPVVKWWKERYLWCRVYDSDLGFKQLAGEGAVFAGRFWVEVYFVPVNDHFFLSFLFGFWRKLTPGTKPKKNGGCQIRLYSHLIWGSIARISMKTSLRISETTHPKCCKSTSWRWPVLWLEGWAVEPASLRFE